MTDEPKNRNLFEDLRRGIHEEALFSVALIALLRRSEALRAAFLDWVSGASGLSLADAENAEWEILGEVRRKVSNKISKGDLFVDMVFESGNIELWFEHKIGAGLGRYGRQGEYDQIQKYLDAAQRRAQGGRRVYVVLIAARAIDIRRHEVLAKAQASGEAARLAWCGECGHLVWADFFGRAAAVVTQMEPGFDKELAEQFLQWWSSLPFMTPVEIPAGWAELFPKEAGKIPPSPLRNLWAPEIAAAEAAGWVLDAQPYAGNSHTYSIPASDSVRQVQVVALETPEKWLGWKSNARRGFAPETVEVAVAGPGVPEVPFEVGRVGDRQWALATTSDGGKYGNRRVRLLIEIGAWAGADDETRANLLRDAVVTGRRILAEQCKIRLEFEPGAD